MREVLGDLDERYPGFLEAIVTEDGGLHRFVNLYEGLSGANESSPQRSKQPLTENFVGQIVR